MTETVDAIVVRDAHGGVRIAAVGSTAPLGVALTILRAGVCGTDLQIASRVRGDRARILGHEALAATGTGAPVVLNPVGVKDQDSILGHSYDGIFRHRCQIPLPDDGGPTLVPASHDMIADLAPLTEPLGAAVYGWEIVRETVEPRTVGIWGGGFAGLACATLGSILGADVVVFCSSESRAGWVRKILGLRAESTFSSAEIGSLDAAFLCVPRTSAAEALDQAVKALSSDGVIDLVGGVPDGVTLGADPGVVAADVRRGNIRGVSSLPSGTVRVRRHDGRSLGVTGHRGTSDTQLHRAQRILCRYPERFSPMITHVVSLHQGARMINRLCLDRCRTDSAGEEIVKVVIDPTQNADRRDINSDLSVGHLLAAL